MDYKEKQKSKIVNDLDRKYEVKRKLRIEKDKKMENMVVEFNDSLRPDCNKKNLYLESLFKKAKMSGNNLESLLPLSMNCRNVVQAVTRKKN